MISNVNFSGKEAIFSKVRRAAPEIEEKYVGDGHLFSDEMVKAVKDEFAKKISAAREATSEKAAYSSPFAPTNMTISPEKTEETILGFDYFA